MRSDREPCHRSLDEQTPRGCPLTATDRFAREVAHDLNNILFVIRGNVHIANNLAESIDLIETLREILSAAQRVAKMADTFQIFSGHAPMSCDRLNLSKLVRTTCDRWTEVSARHAVISLDLANDCILTRSDACLLETLLESLLNNALEATLEHNVDKPTVGVSLRTMPDVYELQVTDNGPGIAESDREKIFEPYFTTRPQQRGMGLALARGIVRSHGGQIHVLCAQPGKTTIGITLPR